MSGRRRGGLSPNLFPFLAVLICTLGTLILMLAMVAQNAGEVMAAAKPDLEQSAVPLPDPVETQRLTEAAAQLERGIREARWHREQSVKIRQSQTADLEERRDRLAHLEDHSRRLREELESLATEVEKSLEESGDVVQVQQTLDQVLADIEREKAAITKLAEDLQTQTPRIVIVPHKGPNGTDRRPVYIECRSDGIYLQPGDRHIPSEHLEPIPGMPNPLDAALRAIRYHAMKEYGDAIAPYPLLVIRPDGIAAYAAARAAMHQWDDQFGYELLPADVELAFPPPDAALDNKVAVTIRQAMDRRAVMMAQLRGSGGGGFGRQGNGYTRDGAGPADGRPDFASGNSRGTLAQGASQGGYGDGDRTTSQGNAGVGPNAALASNSSLPALSAASMSRGDQQGGVGQFRASSDAGQPRGTATEAQAQGIGSGQQAGSGSSGTINGQAGQAGLAGANPTAPGQFGSQSGDGNPGGAQRSGGQPGEAAEGTAPTDGSLASGGSAGSKVGNDSAAMASGSDRLPADQTSDEAATGTDSGTAGTGGSVAAGSLVSGGSGAAGGTGGSQASGSATPPTDGAQSPSVSASFGNTNEPPPVTRVGRDWALPPQSVSGPKTEMLRTIRVECFPDRFVLLPEGGRGETKVYSFADGDIHRASMKLATDVRERVRNWGTSIPGSRWQPVLDVIVAAGAQPRFEQMRQLYEGSGLLIEPREAR